MITWNEETLLPIAVNSTDGLADEIVVVDTGSSDKTIKIAQDLGCAVYTGADRMHKAESRNKAIEKSTGDWVVILDADEQIADPMGLREFLETTDAQAVYVRLAYMDSNNAPTISYQQMRCWRRDAYRYKYRAHPVYYLGRQYMYNKMWQLAVERLTQYIEMTPAGRDAADAWNCLATCYSNLGNKKEQVRSLHLAAAAQPKRRDWWGKLAQIYYGDGNYEVAAGLLKCALEVNPPKDAYTYHSWHGSIVYDLLARCLWKLRRYNEGHQYALKAVTIEPNSDRLKNNLLFFENVVKGQIVTTNGVKLNDTDDKKVVFLAGRDHANVGYRMAQAVNSLDGWSARSVNQATNYIRYPIDVFRPTQEAIDQLCEWADVIHIIDSWDRQSVLKYEKPVFVTYNGKYYRDNRETLQRDDAENGIVQLCTTLDLTEHGARWIPVPMNKMDASPANGASPMFRIAHAPTRKDVKGTIFVESLADSLNVEVDVICGVRGQ
jgi:glycosyltransferase involved in cell wall biosynthesis